jgi:hypothetical protein
MGSAKLFLCIHAGIFLLDTVPAIVLTLMVPYFELDGESALPRAFGQVGWYVAEYVISAGALISLLSR